MTKKKPATAAPSTGEYSPYEYMSPPTVSSDPGMPAVPARRGRPPGRGRGSSRSRGRGHGHGNAEGRENAIPDGGVSAIPEGTDDAAGTAVRPRRALGKYDPGQSIIDTATRRSSEEVLFAKQRAQKMAEDALVAAENKKHETRVRIAMLEDGLQVDNLARVGRDHRPDLVDTYGHRSEVRILHILFGIFD